LFGLAAIILGFVALSSIKKSNGSKTGEGLAIAGVVFGFIDLFAVIILLSLL